MLDEANKTTLFKKGRYKILRPRDLTPLWPLTESKNCDHKNNQLNWDKGYPLEMSLTHCWQNKPSSYSLLYLGIDPIREAEECGYLPRQNTFNTYVHNYSPDPFIDLISQEKTCSPPLTKIKSRVEQSPDELSNF